MCLPEDTTVPSLSLIKPPTNLEEIQITGAMLDNTSYLQSTESRQCEGNHHQTTWALHLARNSNKKTEEIDFKGLVHFLNGQDKTMVPRVVQSGEKLKETQGSDHSESRDTSGNSWRRGGS